MFLKIFCNLCYRNIKIQREHKKKSFAAEISTILRTNVLQDFK